MHENWKRNMIFCSNLQRWNSLCSRSRIMVHCNHLARPSFCNTVIIWRDPQPPIRDHVVFIWFLNVNHRLPHHLRLLFVPNFYISYLFLTGWCKQGSPDVAFTFTQTLPPLGVLPAYHHPKLYILHFHLTQISSLWLGGGCC